MHRPEIRKISSTTFVKHFGEEIKFVTESKGHLYLAFRGKPRATVIPMRDEAVLHELQGRNFEDMMHKAQMRAARLVRASYRENYYRSEIVEDDEPEMPYFHITDEEWEAQKRYWVRRKGPVR